MTLLCYCVQIDLPVQLEIETLLIILAFMLVKQAGSLSRFHVCFHVFLRSFVPFHVLLDPLFHSTCCSGNLRCCCVMSPGKPCWSTGLFDTGPAMLRLLQSL